MSLMIVGRSGAILDSITDPKSNSTPATFEYLDSPDFNYSRWLTSGVISMFIDSREMVDEILYVIQSYGMAIALLHNVPKSSINNFIYTQSSKNTWNRIKRIHDIQDISDKDAEKIILNRINTTGHRRYELLRAFIRPF